MKNYGFQPDKITPDQYIFGSEQLKGVILQQNGQWDKYLPEYEPQSRNFDTMSCVSFGTLNCLEAIYNKIYGERKNYSDRALAIMSETTINGNSPHKVAETIRKMGVMNEELLPFSSNIKSFNEYHTGLTKEHVDKCSEWTFDYRFGHDWVALGDKQNDLKEALKYSPIGVSVMAWRKKGSYYVKNKGEQDNHWCTLYGYEDGKYWKVFDHYDDTYKKLAWDYDFGYAKRYAVELEINKNAYSFFTEIFAVLKEAFLKIIKTPYIDQSKKKEIVDDVLIKLEVIKDSMEKENKTPQECLLAIAKENLGIDVTPTDKIPDEVACAETVSALLRKIAITFPIKPHTMDLYKTLSSSPSFKATLDLAPGNIIISPTGHWKSNGTIRGHVGIILENGKIASNSSNTGKFEVNYTIQTWVNRYRAIGKYPIFVFEMVDKNYQLGSILDKLRINKSVL